MNESFKTDPSLATSARAAKESGSYLCASNVTPTVVRFIVSVFLCLLCSCRMSSTQMTCSHFRKNRPKKKTKTARLPIAHFKQKPAGSDLWPVNRCIPSFGQPSKTKLAETRVPFIGAWTKYFQLPKLPSAYCLSAVLWVVSK